MRSVHLYDEGEISAHLAGLPEWSREGGEIVRRYAFDAYAHGALFVAGIARLADRRDHHPEIVLGYRKVEVRLSTHDPAGITDLDFALAREIESSYSGG